MVKQKINKTIENFLGYWNLSWWPERATRDFKGDGKYYLSYNGKQSTWNKAKKYFLGLYEVLERGNDAPRGGQNGNYEIVKFNDKFYETYGNFINEQDVKRERLIKNNILLNEQKQKSEILFAEYVKNNPKEIEVFKQSVVEKIKNTCSSRNDARKKYRMLVSRFYNKVTKMSYWSYNSFETHAFKLNEIFTLTNL